VFIYLKKTIDGIAHLIRAENPIIQYIRQFKDLVLKPILWLCAKLGITPTMITAIGLFFGLFSFKFLFTHYGLFVVFMTLSAFCDLLDGSFARYSNQSSTFGHKFDFMVDHILMILLVVALSIFTQQIFWCAGALLFSTVLFFNHRIGSPLKIPAGRQTIFIPAACALPELGLALLFLYAIILALLLAKEMFYPLQSLPLQGNTTCKHKSPVLNLLEMV